MTKSRSTNEKEIPLYLVPQVVTRLLREKGGKVYRISVKRTHWHHYNVSVRTKTIPPELRPESVVPKATIPDDIPGEHRPGRKDAGVCPV